MKPEKINIKQFEMHNEKNVHPVYLYIILEEHTIFYAAKYECEAPVSEIVGDHSLGWETVSRNFRCRLKRVSAVSVELYYTHSKKVWTVDIEFNGHSRGISLFFQQGLEAKSIYDKLEQYIFAQ